MEVVWKPWARAWVERPLVQILVVVANIQMGTLKTEVEKGSVGTAVGNGLVGLNRTPSGTHPNVLGAGKGIRARFRNLARPRQRIECGDAGTVPGRSYLFFLTACGP